MQTVERMLSESPNAPSIERGTLAKCMNACAACALVCHECADACDGESAHLQALRRCVRQNLDAAAICSATASVLSRQLLPSHDVLSALLAACAVACAVCAEECESHARSHEHCRVCGDACRRCEELCRLALRDLSKA